MVPVRLVSKTVVATVLCSSMLNAGWGKQQPAPQPEAEMIHRIINAGKNGAHKAVDGMKATPGAVTGAVKKSAEFSGKQYSRIQSLVIDTFHKVGGERIEKWAQENPKAFVALVTVVSGIIAYETFTYGEKKHVKQIDVQNALDAEMKTLCSREDILTGQITILRFKHHDGYFSEQDAEQLKALKAKRDEIRAMKLGLYRAQHALYQFPVRVAKSVMALVQSILQHLPGSN